MTHTILDDHHDNTVWQCPFCTASNQTVIDPADGPEVLIICAECGRGSEVCEIP